MLENYPYYITAGHNYELYIGVGNHLGHSAYYTVYVKLGNEMDLLSNATSTTPSNLPSIYEYRFLLPDNGTWESPLTFTFSRVSTGTNMATVNQLLINGVSFNLNKQAPWNSNTRGYYFALSCELWVYDEEASALKFHNRAVSLQLILQN